MARKASVESPMDITEDKRKNEVELTAIKRAMRNTRWWKVFITVFMIAGIVAPVISIHAISTLQDMGSMLSAKYKEISVDKPVETGSLGVRQQMVGHKQRTIPLRDHEPVMGFGDKSRIQ